MYVVQSLRVNVLGYAPAHQGSWRCLCILMHLFSHRHGYPIGVLVFAIDPRLKTWIQLASAPGGKTGISSGCA